MKKLIGVSLIVLCAIAAQAQYIFKTAPKTFTDEIGLQKTVIGIQARIVSSVDIELSDKVERTFYIAFQLSDSTFFGQRNATTKEFIARAGGSPSAEANIIAVVKALEFGTVAQKYAAAQQLSAIYGYTLLPLSQQEQR